MDPSVSGFASVDYLINVPARPSPWSVATAGTNNSSSKTMSSIITPSVNTLQDIQSHLYNAFLSGDTADINLHTRGDGWDLGYRFHRIVLIQAVSGTWTIPNPDCDGYLSRPCLGKGNAVKRAYRPWARNFSCDCVTSKQVCMWDASASIVILAFWHEWYPSALTDPAESVDLWSPAIFGR